MIHAYPRRANLLIARAMCEFIEAEVLPGTGLDHELFWLGFGKIVNEFTLQNKTLLEKREYFQKQITQWHKTHPAYNPRNKNHLDKYRSHLQQIGYLEPDIKDFNVSTNNIDPELSQQTGPQIIVAANNDNELIQAANARWGSLINALYHADIIEKHIEEDARNALNSERITKVLNYALAFLDKAIPLCNGSHLHAQSYTVTTQGTLQVTLKDGQISELENNNQLLGYQGSLETPSTLLLSNNDLKIEIHFNSNGFIGKLNTASIDDITLESALSVIVDSEDTVSSADVDEKLLVYRNWHKLMCGSLQTTNATSSAINVNRLKPDRAYTQIDGRSLTVPGQPVYLIRNVGLHLTHSAILDEKQQPIPEGIMDAVITAAIALKNRRNTLSGNTQTSNIYIVKPKLHGSEEVAFTCDLFKAIEKLLHVPEDTIKLGLIDEERRTSLNLKNCIHAARSRIALLCSEFGDRIADEINTAIHAGPVTPKSAIINEDWFRTYEANTIKQALACGMSGKAQIGQGLWTYPENHADIMTNRKEFSLHGGNSAWVLTQHDATLYALHCHQINLLNQHTLEGQQSINPEYQLKLPLLIHRNMLTPSMIKTEIDNLCLAIVSYLVHWITLGDGNPLVTNNNGATEKLSRSSLRMNSQLLANWLEHDICTSKQLEESLIRVARDIDDQHMEENHHMPISNNNGNSLILNAARTLIFAAKSLPNGYTEMLLRDYRLRFKAGATETSNHSVNTRAETA